MPIGYLYTYVCMYVWELILASFPAKEGESLVHFIMCVMSRVDITSSRGGGLSRAPMHVQAYKRSCDCCRVRYVWL